MSHKFPFQMADFEEVRFLALSAVRIPHRHSRTKKPVPNALWVDTEVLGDLRQ